MKTKTIVLSDVPEDQVEMEIAILRLDDPTQIEKKQQPDGRWTLRATYEVPDGTSAAMSAAHHLSKALAGIAKPAKKKTAKRGR
jgi:hypothetical protein